MTDRVESTTTLARLQRAVLILEHQAALADETGRPDFARVYWQKRAEAASQLKRATTLMKNTGSRLW
jgi:phage shock protein A